MNKGIDLRSDTVTQPTEAMLAAMHSAVVGDDVFGEDKTVTRLEELAAGMLGKESGLFVASGTMGNLLATLTHTRPGDEVLVERFAHTYYSELGGMSTIAGVIPAVLESADGVIRPEDVDAACGAEGPHETEPTLLYLENTHNLRGGTVSTVQQMDDACTAAKKWNLKVHVDGARLFNAAVALGVPAKDLVRGADSVMICLAKSLGAPIGSVLVGPKDWIAKARRWRKMLGGGMRQAGHMAAAGIVALETMVDRLAEDHANAKFLGEALNQIPGLKVNLALVHTNLVYAQIDKNLMTPRAFEDRLNERGVHCFAASRDSVRFATHKDVTRPEIVRAIAVIKELLGR